jgi:hypothetical protein
MVGFWHQPHEWGVDHKRDTLFSSVWSVGFSVGFPGFFFFYCLSRISRTKFSLRGEECNIPLIFVMGFDKVLVHTMPWARIRMFHRFVLCKLVF